MQTVIKPHPMMPMQGPAGPIGERGEPGEPGLPAGFEHQTFTLRRGDPGEPGPTLEEFLPLGDPALLEEFRVLVESIEFRWFLNLVSISELPKGEGLVMAILGGLPYRIVQAKWNQKTGRYYKKPPANALPCEDRENGSHRHIVLCDRNDQRDRLHFEAFDQSGADLPDGFYIAEKRMIILEKAAAAEGGAE